MGVCVPSAIHDVLPARVRRSLSKFGHDLAIARRKRQLTVGMMAVDDASRVGALRFQD